MATDGTPARHDHPRRPLRQLAARRPAHPLLATLIGTGLVVYAWVDAAAIPFSRGALLGVAIPGMVLGAIAVARPPERIPAPEQIDTIGASYWMICLTAFFEWEASAWRDNSWPWHPSFTNLIDPMLGPHLIKTAAIVVWLLAGWALVRR
jgi:hypothetical protein